MSNMKTKFKLIAFDLAKAKTPETPDGLEVVTRKGDVVRIICTNLDSHTPIVCAYKSSYSENVTQWYIDGKYYADEDSDMDLFLKQPIK